MTGRTERAGDSTLAGTIHETAAMVTAAGGQGIAVRVDHSDDEQVTFVRSVGVPSHEYRSSYAAVA